MLRRIGLFTVKAIAGLDSREFRSRLKRSSSMLICFVAAFPIQAWAHRVDRPTYSSIDEALDSAFHGADRYEAQNVPITPELRALLEERLQARFPFRGVRIHHAMVGSHRLGRAIVTQDIAYSRPFRLLVALDEEERVIRVELLGTRDRRDDRVHDRNFMEQFEGRGLGEGLTVGSDIEVLPGTARSAAAVSRGVSRVLEFVDVLDIACTTGRLPAACH